MNKWLAAIAIVIIIICVVAIACYFNGRRKYNQIMDGSPEEFKEKRVSFADEHGLPLEDSLNVSEIEKATLETYPEELVQKVEARDTITQEPVIDMPTFQMSGMMHNVKTESQIKKEIPKYNTLIGINRHENYSETNLEEKDFTDTSIGMFKRNTKQMAQPIKPRLSLGMRMMGAEQAAAMIQEFEKKPEDMKQANMAIAKIEEKKQQTKKQERKHRKAKD